MRSIFIDEAGTSQHEPATVVVGLIVDRRQYVLAALAVADILRAVPRHHVPENGFIFHATDIWNLKALREGWTFDARLRLIQAMLTVPRRLGIPIALGIVRPGMPIWDPGLTEVQNRHLQAFSHCMWAADGHLREWVPVGVPVECLAENVPNMEGMLAKVPDQLRSMNIKLEKEHLIPTAQEIARGEMYQSGELRLERIGSKVTFAPKGDALLMIADACAFAFRRFFAGLKGGDVLVATALNGRLHLPDWRGFSSGSCFFHPEWGDLLGEANVVVENRVATVSTPSLYAATTAKTYKYV